MFLMVYANKKGEIFEHKELFFLGRTGNNWVEPEKTELIPLPKGASLVSIPGFLPVGIDGQEQVTLLEEDPYDRGKKIDAVAALLPQGFTRTYLPACVGSTKETIMPVMGYAAVAFKEGVFYVAAIKSDEHRKWHPCNYNTNGLPDKIAAVLKKYPQNQVVNQLAHCSLEYGCYTAQNIFYGRWEGGIPTFHSCNADCIGCISESHIPTDSPQHRLKITPSIEEIAAIGTFHLERSREGIISFGQGCEGEPALNADRIAPAIKKIRANTCRGTINMNSNAGYTEGIKKICDAGLDSLRVTIFSPQEKNYDYYHRPRNFSLQDVQASINYAKEKGVKVSLNLLVFPGFTDQYEETEALLDFVKRNRVNMIQLRNLNIDPDVLFAGLPLEEETMGIVNYIKLLKQELPKVQIGSYSYPVVSNCKNIC